MAPVDVASVGARVAEALAFAHDRGVVHRDIKPANVLVSDLSRPLVADFGISAHHDDSQLTQTGLVGTLAYIAPERFAGEPADGTSDVFSLGVTLYQMVEGVLPFDAATTAELIYSILHRPPRPSVLAGPLEPVLTAMLSKAPADRPDAATSAGMLAASGRQPEPTIDRSGAHPVATTPAEPTPATAQPSRRPAARPETAHGTRSEPRGRLRWLVVATAVTAVVAAVLLVAALANRGEHDAAGSPRPLTGTTPSTETGSQHRTTPTGSPGTTAAATVAPVATAGSSGPTSPPVAPLTVEVRVQADLTWLFVSDDTGQTLLQQILYPGEARTFHAARSLRLHIGNAGVVRLTCDGRNFGTPGAEGRIATVVFTPGPRGTCVAA